MLENIMPILPNNFEQLLRLIVNTDKTFRAYAQKQVNISLTLRNWFIGYYIFFYEQNGDDRAKYGSNIIGNLAKLLKDKSLKGFSATNLKLYRQFYQTYPEIGQSLPDQFIIKTISQSTTDQFINFNTSFIESFGYKNSEFTQTKEIFTDPIILINHLSFTHIIELLKSESDIKRCFYETEAIKNSWSVRELSRAMNSMLYERQGLGKHKEAGISNLGNEPLFELESVIKNPYILEFLGIEEKAEFSESDLEEAIINHIQKFLMELGRGFCFESRQRRITFDNTHYFIDLVFYHRILKCHILIDLKLGEFNHSDAGQMNLYLNYFKDNEITEGDSDPIGIILCAGKNDQLVKYATGGLSQKVFVSKYLINLPKEEELKKIIIEEQNKRIKL